MAEEKKEVAVTEKQVAAMIAEALKSLVTNDQLKSVLDSTRENRDKLVELEEQIRGLVASRLEVSAPPAIGDLPLPPLDPAWLDDLTFAGAKQKEITEEGRKKLVSVPFERPLQVDDVLSWKVNGTTVTLVTADGRKHQVEI